MVCHWQVELRFVCVYLLQGRQGEKEVKKACQGHFKSYDSVSQTISWITFYHNYLEVIKIQIQGSSQDYDPGCFRWSSQPHTTALQGQSVKQMSSTNWAMWHLKYSGWGKVGSQPLITGRLREDIFKGRVRLRLALLSEALQSRSF